MTDATRPDTPSAAAIFPSARQFHSRVLTCKAGLLASDLLGFMLPFILFRHALLPAPIVFYQIQNGAASAVSTGVDWYMCLVLSTLTILHFLGFYSVRRGFWDELRFLIQAVLIAAAIDIAVLFFSGHGSPAMTPVLGGWLVALLALPTLRSLARLGLRRCGLWGIPTLIVGTGANALQTLRMLRSDHALGFAPAAFASLEADNAPATLEDLPVVGLDKDLIGEQLAALEPSHIVVALDDDQLGGARHVIDHASHRPNTLDIVPPLRGLPLYGTDVVHLFGQEVLMLRVRNNLARRSPRLAKRLFDIVGSAALLVLLSPVFLFLCFRIWREDKGTPFYSQMRIGVGGKQFSCHKFRSMYTDSDQILARWKVEQPDLYAEYIANACKLRNDPRVTPIGRVIRAYSLDELPQLWNVLKGEMSLVGPRPLVTQEIPNYGPAILHYYRLRPGITGLWQVSGRSDTTIAERVAFDEWYAKNWSLWSDLVILLKTVNVVISRRGAF